jgi:hypothetical protein
MTLLHFADLHLDTPFCWVNREQPRKCRRALSQTSPSVGSHWPRQTPARSCAPALPRSPGEWSRHTHFPQRSDLVLAVARRDADA